MSKKDTVIIAILLNAGLLIVLFATSLKSDPSDVSQTVNIETPQLQKEEVLVSPSTQPQVLEIAKTPAPLTGDEVDQMIRQYTPPPIASAPVDIKPNFADDLQALGGLMPSQENIPSASTQASSYKEVKVKKGDVLEKIARLNHVTVEEIMKANQMTSTRLRIGQVLKIPAKVKKETVVTSAAHQDSAAKYYTIKNGDNLWAIAVKNQMKMEDLLKLNNLTDEKARKLKAGDQIRIK